MRPFVLLAFTLFACSGPSAPVEQGGGAVLITPQPAAMRVSGWLEFRDLTFHPVSEKGPPHEPFIRGEAIGGFFDPTSEITGPVGDPPKGRNLTKGWLELRTRAFFRSDDPRQKTPPFVEGSRDDDTGGFFPASPLVRTIP